MNFFKKSPGLSIFPGYEIVPIVPTFEIQVADQIAETHNDPPKCPTVGTWASPSYGILKEGGRAAVHKIFQIQ